MVFQHRRFEQEFPQFVGRKVSQKVAYSHLSGKRPAYDFKMLITKRLRRYFPLETMEPQLQVVLGLYKSSASTLGYAPALSHLRAICNHWCTYSRFGNKDHPCCFGCGYHTDQIAHTVACPKFWEVFFVTCGIAYQRIEFEEIALLHGPWIGESAHRARFVFLACHICFLSYHSCKHGAHFSSRLVLHKLYTYTRNHPKTAKFLRQLKYFERRALH